MGRTRPLDKDEGLESVLDPEQSQRPSKEEVDAALVRVRALRAQIVQEQQALASKQGPDMPSMAYTQILERILESLNTAHIFTDDKAENFTDVAADGLRILAEATLHSTRELHQYMPMKTPEAQAYMELKLSLNERLLIEINEFI